MVFIFEWLEALADYLEHTQMNNHLIFILEIPVARKTVLMLKWKPDYLERRDSGKSPAHPP